MCINKVADYVSKGMINEARQAASALKDFRKTKHTIERNNPLYHKNPFHIYRINNGSMNNGSDYIFKFSKFIAENIAVQMYIDEPYNILQEKNAYFDATHTQVHGFKSFGLWTYHPTMWETIRLASMEMCMENTKNISTFFIFLNEILSDVTGKRDYKFNPRCFMCDEGRANYNAIKNVYDEEFCAEGV